MKKFFFLTLTFLGSIFMFSCTKDNAYESQNLDKAFASIYSNLTLEDFQSEVYDLDMKKSYEYLSTIYNLKAADGGHLIKNKFEQLGNPAKNPELLYALLVSEQFTEERIFTKEEMDDVQLEEDDSNIETRAIRTYKWDGINHKYDFWLRTNYYKCYEYVNFTKSCSGAHKRMVWRSCFNVDCNVPRCLF